MRARGNKKERGMKIVCICTYVYSYAGDMLVVYVNVGIYARRLCMYREGWNVDVDVHVRVFWALCANGRRSGLL